MIEFNNVSKKYKEQQVLNNFSFRIGDNDFTLLVGHNGSGKTTIINLILGILKITKEDSGEIIDDFADVSYFPEKFNLPALMKSVNFLHTYFKESLSKDIVDKYIEKYHILNKCICNLSKGMCQKVILVKTLLEESNLYIFDEPLNGLDDESRELFKEDLIALHKRGKSILISTHDPKFFMDTTTNIIRLGE